VRFEFTGASASRYVLTNDAFTLEDKVFAEGRRWGLVAGWRDPGEDFGHGTQGRLGRPVETGFWPMQSRHRSQTIFDYCLLGNWK